MGVQTTSERAAAVIEHDFRYAVTALATDMGIACSALINATGTHNIAAERVQRMRIALELAGRDEAEVFMGTIKVGDNAHIFWAFFSLLQAASAALMESTYARLSEIERANPGLEDGWALMRCFEQSKIVSDAISVWPKNATEPGAAEPWFAPAYLLELPINGTWPAPINDRSRLDESGTSIVASQLRLLFNLKLMGRASDLYGRDLVAAAQKPQTTGDAGEADGTVGRNKKNGKSRLVEPLEADSHRYSVAGYKGADWAAQMNNCGHKTPRELQAQGCPPSFVDAHRLPKWRQPLSKWKSQVDRKFLRRKEGPKA